MKFCKNLTVTGIVYIELKLPKTINWILVSNNTSFSPQCDVDMYFKMTKHLCVCMLIVIKRYQEIDAYSYINYIVLSMLSILHFL